MSVDAKELLANLSLLINKLPNAVDRGIAKAAEDGATLARNKTYYTPRSGLLQSQTYAETPGNGRARIVANTFYAAWVDGGNGPPGTRIYPVKAKALRFELNKQIVFAASVKTSAPKPFMSNALTFEETYFSTALASSINALFETL